MRPQQYHTVPAMPSRVRISSGFQPCDRSTDRASGSAARMESCLRIAPFSATA
jgi:hypothetical protein